MDVEIENRGGQFDRAPDEKQAERAANDAQKDGFDEEFEQNEPSFRAERLFDADDIRALFYRNEHDIGHAEHAHEQRKPADKNAHAVHHAERAVEQFADHRELVEREIVLFERFDMPRFAEVGGQFVLHVIEVDARFCLGHEARARPASIRPDIANAASEVETDEDGVVKIERFEQVFATFFEGADDAEFFSTKIDDLPDRVDASAKKPLRNGAAEQAIIDPGFVFDWAEIAAVFKFEVKKLLDIIRRTDHIAIFDARSLPFDGLIANEHPKPELFGQCHPFFEELELRERDVGPLHPFPKILAGVLGPTEFFDINNVVAQLLDRFADIVFQRIDRRFHPDDAENADRDAEQRQETAQFVAHQLRPGLRRAFF